MTGGSNSPTVQQDPGLQYLYSTKGSKPPQQRSSTAGAQEPVLVMAPLPRDATEPGSGRDWGSAVGNVETAKLALETLRGLIADAVFLDEDAYTNASTLQHYHQRLQVCRVMLEACNAVVRSLGHSKPCDPIATPVEPTCMLPAAERGTLACMRWHGFMTRVYDRLRSPSTAVAILLCHTD